MDHSLESHVDLATANDLGDIGRVIRFEKGDLETLVFEVTSRLSEIQRGVVRGGVPFLFEKKEILSQQTRQVPVDDSWRGKDHRVK